MCDWFFYQCEFCSDFCFCIFLPSDWSHHHRFFSTSFGLKCQDVEDVKFVINYDYPNSSEDYIHRIGRTARSTNKGTAYTFFTPGNIRQARDLIRVLEEARQAINPKLMQLVNTGRGGAGGICLWISALERSYIWLLDLNFKIFGPCTLTSILQQSKWLLMDASIRIYRKHW